MKPTITVIGEAWFWQIFKIVDALEKGKGFLGKYRYSFSGDKQVSAEICIFKIKPFFWRRLLKHEMEHHRITQSSSSFDEAVRRNKEFDEKTNHGICAFCY